MVLLRGGADGRGYPWNLLFDCCRRKDRLLFGCDRAWRECAQSFRTRGVRTFHACPLIGALAFALRFCLRYLIDKDVCYLTLCEKAYPRKLAIRYLEELAREFDLQFGAEVANAKRPYQFIKFGTCSSADPHVPYPRQCVVLYECSSVYSISVSPNLRCQFCSDVVSVTSVSMSPSGHSSPDNQADTFIQKTKRLYNDTKSQRNLQQVSEDLQDVHRILTRNIEDILGRGEKLSSQSCPDPLPMCPLCATPFYVLCSLSLRLCTHRLAPFSCAQV